MEDLGFSLQLVTKSTGQFAVDAAQFQGWMLNTSSTVLVALVRDSAREYIERETRRQLFTATYLYAMNRFPRGRVILLPRPPLQSVTSVQYLDENNVLQTLSTSMYTVHSTQEPGMVELNVGALWPQTLDLPSSVRILYVCGYGATDALIPRGLTMAFVTIGRHYAGASQGDTIASDTFRGLPTLPPVFERLVRAYRVPWDPPD